MKGFALVLLCIAVAVQGRSTSVQSEQSALAALGENPWLVHLRIAVATSGLLQTCSGSLIHPAWVASAHNCLRDARYVWVRYGTIRVWNPELVTESATAAIRLNPDLPIALISVNRVVQTTPNIAPVALASKVPVFDGADGNFCGFGAHKDVPGEPGEWLSCYNVNLTSDDKLIVATSKNNSTTRFDVGGPLVVDDIQVAILIDGGNGDNAGTFESVADSLTWIRQVTDLDF